MLPALKAALADAAASGDAGMVRQIIFLTDGEISNEAEMLALLGQDGGKSHIFMVGIGSAPNDYLMRAPRDDGARHLHACRHARRRAGEDDRAARNPAPPEHAGRKVVVSGAVEVTPKDLPDVYAGQSLVLLGRTDHLKGKMTVSGRLNGRQWTQTLDLANSIESTAVSKMWARRRIDEVETEATLTTISYEQADKEIERLGMEHSIVTRRTLVWSRSTKRRHARQTSR